MAPPNGCYECDGIFQGLSQSVPAVVDWLKVLLGEYVFNGKVAICREEGQLVLGECQMRGGGGGHGCLSFLLKIIV